MQVLCLLSLYEELAEQFPSISSLKKLPLCSHLDFPKNNPDNSIIDEKSLYNLIFDFIMAIFKKIGMCPVHEEKMILQDEEQKDQIILGSKNPLRENKPVIFAEQVEPDKDTQQLLQY